MPADDDLPVFADGEAAPWDDLLRATGRSWSETASSGGAAMSRFAEGVRIKRVFASPDFRFGYIEMAPGMVYPSHRHPAPEIYHMVAGRARWTVDDESAVVGPGTSIHMRPMAAHRIEAVSTGPMRALWAQWAPGGDQSYLDRGYELLEGLPPLPDSARLAESTSAFFAPT